MSAAEIIREFKNLGSLDEINCGLAYRLYVDLKDVLRVKNLKKSFSKEFNILYFEGQEEKKDEGQEKEKDDVVNLYLPMASCQDFDFLQIEKIQRDLCSDDKRLIVCICDPNSTILYFNFTNKWTD